MTNKVNTPVFQDAIPIRRVPELLPGNPTLITVYRWIRHGIDGVKLPSIRIGGRRFVRRSDLQAFVERMTDASAPRPPMEPLGRAARRRAKHDAAVKAYLDREGF
jgi:hypothetical protein